MQRQDEKKRQIILAKAAKMFASKPFHKVRLDDIATAARVGKGTLYIYFQSKEDLYYSLIFGGFEQLVERIRSSVDTSHHAELARSGNGRVQWSALAAIGRIVDELVGFAFAHPHFFELMRTNGLPQTQKLNDPSWDRKRLELQELIVSVIRKGVLSGELEDPNPELTATCLGGMVRSVMLFGPKQLSQDEVAGQLRRLLERGIARGGRR